MKKNGMNTTMTKTIKLCCFYRLCPSIFFFD